MFGLNMVRIQDRTRLLFFFTWLRYKEERVCLLHGKDTSKDVLALNMVRIHGRTCLLLTLLGYKEGRVSS